MLGFNGGLMGVRRATTGRSASGLWFPNEQSAAKSVGLWPVQPGIYSQSSVFSGTTPASAAIMTDGSFSNTGAATNTSTNEWIQIDYGSSIFISSVVIGTATSSIPGGWNKSYTENRSIQASTDGSTWTTLFNTGSFAANGIYTFSAPSRFVALLARYIRIQGTGFVAISEFYAA